MIHLHYELINILVAQETHEIKEATDSLNADNYFVIYLILQT